MTSTIEVFENRNSFCGKKSYKDGVTKKGNPDSYSDRLKTYTREPQSWPLRYPTPEELAMAGFIYTGQGTQVTCPECGIYVEDWNDTSMDPVRKHYIRNRTCGFLHKHHELRVQDMYLGSRYSDVSLRLTSFANWPSGAPVQPSALASAGFYYTGEGMRVRCFSCAVHYGEWKLGDLPVFIHSQLNPLCEFLVDLLKDKYPATRAFGSAMYLPDYSSAEVRLMSFKNWKNPAVTKEELAEGGLYLVEMPDVVRCYACGVELRDWGPGDTPMGRHERESPRCSLVRQHRLVAPLSAINISIDTPPENRQPRGHALHDRSLLHTSEPSRRHSDNGVYLPPSYSTLSAPPLPSYVRSGSFPYDPTSSLPRQFAASVLCSDDVRSDSSPRWMLDAGVDIRLPPTLVKHTTSSYAGEPAARSVRPVSMLTTTLAPPILTVPPSPPHLKSKSIEMEVSPPAVPTLTSVGSLGSVLDDSKICQICFENMLSMVFIPCGHVCTCESCAVKVANCPLCRRPIEQTVRFFLP